MKIDKISLNNFRQYWKENPIELPTTTNENIILIGGKNGYGKTNFLLSLVWCLYGEDISKIDENFKREIQRKGSYSNFLKSSLNDDSEKSGDGAFSVEIDFSEIELPETPEFKAGEKYQCKLKRTFNIKSNNEDFEIVLKGIPTNLFNETEYKKVFVNDYLIPIEAAKFVFFDAEKIASWAELSTKEEGHVLNDALGKILGLDVYESLIEDLETYTDGLRKESATSSVRQQIAATEMGIQIRIEEIAEIERDVFAKEAAIIEHKKSISSYEAFLAKHGTKVLNNGGLEQLYKEKKELEFKERQLGDKFNELSEIIPFAIAAGTLEEVMEHLAKQEANHDIREGKNELIEKNNQLIEKLFNNPPFPIDGDIPFTKKTFYAEKAKQIIDEVFGENLGENDNDLDFEHDLNKSDKDLLSTTFQYIEQQSKDIFEQTIESFNRIKNEILEIDKLIRKIEADQEDEEVIRYTANKNDAERKIEKLNQEKGALQNQKEQSRKAIESDNQKLHILIKKIEVSEQKRRKLDKASQYIKSLQNFVDEQKKSKCTLLGTGIFEEMNRLMHKKDFIGAVKADILPDNDGLKITLYNTDGTIKEKDKGLSEGEKQIYISCLVKTILSLSIQELPIFIDTPLGRLDREHIENVLREYYPNLANQVIIIATDNEITTSRYKLIKENVAQAYILEHKDQKTKFTKGYYLSHEN